MSIVPPQAVDWTGWSSNATQLVCPACRHTFVPNHPRRRYCGRAECPGRKRTRRRDAAKRRRGPRQTPPVDRSTLVHGLFGDALVELNRPAGPVGSRSELGGALRAMVLAERAGDVAGQERAVVALMSAGMMRVYQTRAGRPADT